MPKTTETLQVRPEPYLLHLTLESELEDRGILYVFGQEEGFTDADYQIDDIEVCRFFLEPDGC